jgi:hypothetical protein
MIRIVLCLVLTPLALLASPMIWSLSFVDFNALDADGNPGSPQVVCRMDDAACIGSVGVPNTIQTMTYDAHATAHYGQFNAYGSASISGPAGGTPPNYYSAVWGRSAWQDVITINGGTPDTPGTLILQFTVTGTTSVSTAGNCVGDADNCAGSGFNVRLFDAVGGHADYTFYTDTSGLATSPAISFIFDQPLEYALWFTAGINIWDFSDGSSATSDFSHTATLTKIQVLTSDQQNLADFQIQAQSGAQYTANGIVPEPATILLLIAAIPCLGFLRRWRR